MSATPKVRRMVRLDALDLGGRQLWAIGFPRIARLAGVTEAAVRKAVQRGTLDPSDPLALARWILARAPEVKP